MSATCSLRTVAPHCVPRSVAVSPPNVCSTHASRCATSSRHRGSSSGCSTSHRATRIAAYWFGLAAGSSAGSMSSKYPLQASFFIGTRISHAKAVARARSRRRSCRRGRGGRARRRAPSPRRRSPKVLLPDDVGLRTNTRKGQGERASSSPSPGRASPSASAHAIIAASRYRRARRPSARRTAGTRTRGSPTLSGSMTPVPSPRPAEASHHLGSSAPRAWSTSPGLEARVRNARPRPAGGRRRAVRELVVERRGERRRRPPRLR